MIEIAKGRFVAATAIKCANIYDKDKNGKWRIAFQIDTVVKEEQVKFSDEFATYEEAKKFLANLTIIS